MAVDKNLFMYDLAVVTIAKNEGLYIKEWVDYHLLAGVNHFYVYDNDSSDNQKEVLQPYIDAGIVTYTFFPGKARQYEAYNDAVQNYKFFCRYMAFIDADEFIFPQSDKSIVEVVDEILSDKLEATGLAVNIHNFGSNFQEKADYTRGILERFTHRASDSQIWLNAEKTLPAGNMHVSSIVNPRKVDYFWNPHYAVFFNNLHSVNEKGDTVERFFNIPPTVDKIVMNHYPMKSREEYEKKVARGAADYTYNIYEKHPFEHIYNDEFDDGILKYRELRQKIFSLENFPLESDEQIQNRIIDALNQNLLSVSPNNIPKNFLEDRAETFLTCLAVSEKFQFKIEERYVSQYALFWIYQSLPKVTHAEDLFLFFSALPEILTLPFPMTEKIRLLCIGMMPSFIEYLRVSIKTETKQYNWQKIIELKHLLKMLQTFDAYTKK